MANESNLQARVEALEKRLSVPLRTGRFWSTLVFLLLCGVFSANLWLVLQQLEKASKAEKEHLFWIVCHSENHSQREDAFLKLVALKNTEWRSARLNGLTFKKANLQGVDLQNADFSESDLSGANLADSLLIDCKFRLVNLTGADLSRVEAARSDFRKAVLTKCNFRAANLHSASLQQAVAKKAQLVTASLADAFLPMIDLTDADLTGTDFTGAVLDSATLKGANLWLARFSGASLRDIDLTDANWWRARGFTTDQIEEFKKLFPPSENADLSRRKDYLLWLQASTNPPPESP